MSFLLMIFLTLVCLYEKYPAPLGHESPLLSLAFAVGGVLLVAGHAFWVSRRVSWPLARDPSRRESLLERYERERFFHQLLQIGVFVVTLSALGWGWMLYTYWQPAANRHRPGLAGLEVLLLLPYLLGQLFTWVFFYDADRAAHRAAHHALEGDSFASTWLESRQEAALAFDGRWSYVLFQARQKLALVFIPVLLLIAHKELIRLLPESWQSGSVMLSVIGSLALAGVFVSMPLIIRIVLGLKPLPEGPIRSRLLAAARRLRFRTSNILLWNTRSGMANAMVIGLLPWLRYVVFTDRLLEEFSEDEVEAVFGHEVGHVRHQHMLYYLLFLVTSMVVMGVAADLYLLPWFDWHGSVIQTAVEPRVTEPAGDLEPLRGGLLVFPLVGGLLVYVFTVFGFLSRRCERQADLFGCRAVSCGSPHCCGHDATTELVPSGNGLCVTGILTFIRALDKVALVNGINRERPGFLQSWQHSTIARRVAFLDRVIIDRTTAAQFQRRLGWVKWGLMAGLLAALAAMMSGNGWHY